MSRPLKPEPAKLRTSDVQRCALTANLGNQENGCMKTTIELPDGLVREIKLRALNKRQKLKDAVAELLRIKGLDLVVLSSKG